MAGLLLSVCKVSSLPFSTHKKSLIELCSASMVLRRPNLVRWTNYMKECIEVLESHPDAAPSDRLFCQHVKIQHICEEIGLQFLMDDNTATISITDPKVSYALNVLETQLKTWKDNVPEDCRTGELRFFEHVTELYLHEIALHFNHNIEDFRLPITEESLKSVANTSDTLTQNQMAALEACLKAAHGILETMLSFEKSFIKTLPMLLFFVRCVYALVILIKMHVAVCSPGSELGKMMRPEDLKVDYYVDSLMSTFGGVADEQEFRPHPKILRILAVLKDWFGKHKANVLAQQRGEKPKEDPQQNQKQTPLHLLSQVATGNQQQAPLPVGGPHGSEQWSFNSATPIDYAAIPQDQRLSVRAAENARQEAAALSSRQHGNPAEGANMQFDPYAMTMDSMVDPTNQDYGWGSGFEQAMDLALGGMDGLGGGGLDGWFLGDSMAPFDFGGGMGDMGQGSGGGGNGGGSGAGAGMGSGGGGNPGTTIWGRSV